MISKRGSRGHQSTAVIADKRSKPITSFKYCVTEIIECDETYMVGQSGAVLKSKIAPGTAFSNSIAVEFCAATSGSTLRLPSRRSAHIVGGPVQDALLPNVKVARQHK